ncbi:MAG: hypothetical protein JTT11_06675 [Candidatus Brockarchaeota archaeon]|nr:hypothetical protein [Candidatus Brockarchaeota archaeon]
MNIKKVVKMIEKEFADGQVKQIAYDEMIRRLKERGMEQEDIEEALHEAQRRKIIDHRSGFYKWIDPTIREAEKAKTREHHELLAEIFKHGKLDFLPEEDVILSLKERGFDDEEVDYILMEAERDFVLHFASQGFGPDYNLVPGCSWIPPEERKRVARAQKAGRKFLEKWHEKKVMQEELREEIDHGSRTTKTR